MSGQLEVNTGYEPRPLQSKLHKELKRFNVLVCHRRFGKTVFSINEMIDRGIRSKRENPRYAYIAPLYSQAKRIAWDYLKTYTRDIPGAKANEHELRIDLPMVNNARFMLLGADNPDSLRGIYLDGVILDEYAEMNKKTWTEVLRPALADREGWAIFIGTPKGRNHFYEIYNYAKEEDSWHTALFDGEKTNVLPKSELGFLKQTMDEAEYDQEIRCKFDTAQVGAYYGKEIQKAQAQDRITDVPHDPALVVNTAWDLGIADKTAIWFFQQFGSRIQIIEYLEYDGDGLDEAARLLQERPYQYGEHYFPWDIKARDLSTGNTRLQTVQRLLKGRCVVVPRQRIEDGINAARLLLPKCWFDVKKTEKGMDALKNYRRKWDAKNDMFMNVPVHNWASHGADAFRYLALGLKEDRFDSKDLPRQALDDYDILSI